MGTVYTGFTERVRYTLFHKHYGTKIIQDPEGWESDEKEIARNEEYHGIFANFSNSLKFVGDGRDFIKFVYEVYGVNADIRLVKEEMHPLTDLWEKSYDGYLDLSTYEYQDNKVGIKFNAGGLEQILKARESEQVEIDRETTMDSKTIEPLVPKEVLHEGRKIFLKSRWEANKDDNTAVIKVYSTDGNSRSNVVGFPLSLTQKSHEEAQSVTNNTDANPLIGEPANMFIANSNEARELHIYGNVKFLCLIPNFVPTNYAKIWACLSVYQGGDNYILKGRLPLWQFECDNEHGQFFALNGQTIALDIDKTIQINRGDSVALEFYLEVDYNAPEGFFTVATGFSECNIKVDEDSFFEQTKSKMILIHDLCERLCRIMSSQTKAFYSEYFGRTDLGYAKNGIGAFIGVTHGFWIRGFDKLPLSTDDEPNPFKPLTTSFKDTMASLNTVCNVGLGIERRGYSERIVLEELKYFYNSKVTIKLGSQVKKVKRSVAGKYYYSSLELGYEKGGDYEEAMGLDEYNAKSTFTTIITRFKQSFIKISKFRADSYGEEFARRKQKFRYSTVDTSYDTDVFLKDMKPDASGVYRERRWRDDFAQAPVGTYDPESATNLRFSPFNILLRHSWVIAAGFTKYPTDYIMYGSSTANSNLKTRLRNDANYNLDTSATPGNGTEYAENERIINNQLKRARYFPEFIEFEFPVTFDIMQQVEGTTEHNGKTIYNKYGLVEFINENNETEKGFLMNLKPNDGKWKVLKFNR